MYFTRGLNFGGIPNDKIQFSRAPMSKMTSACRRVVLRAEETFKGLESGMMPLPMGVGRKGRWVVVMRWRIGCSARQYAAPLPRMIRGERADLRSVAAAEIRSGSGAGLGGGRTVSVGTAGFDDAVGDGEGLMITSAGRSMNDGPGRPYQHVRYPV